MNQSFPFTFFCTFHFIYPFPCSIIPPSPLLSTYSHLSAHSIMFRLTCWVYYSDTVLTTEVVNIQLNIGYWTTDQYTVDQVEVFIIKKSELQFREKVNPLSIFYISVSWWWNCPWTKSVSFYEQAWRTSLLTMIC